LKLGVRTLIKAGANGATGPQGPGAITEADGNMMVGPGGHPVYASVHMNSTYFNAAKANMLTYNPATKSYQYAPSTTPYFPVGSAVFKATWIQVVGKAPAGAYTTQAQVPNLTQVPPGTGTIMPSGTYSTVTVALVGLHVVGETENHPEFVWGTFEHNLNTPATPDFTFPSGTTGGTGPAGTCSTAPGGAAWTFCPAGTSYLSANKCSYPGKGQFGCTGGLKASSGIVSPITSAVQENATGGDTLPNGPSDINNVNAQGQSHLPGVFPYYHLIGTVWMAPNTYNVNSGVANSVGSVNLANTTAETFQQSAVRQPPFVPTGPQGPTGGPTNNCFECHNPQSNNYTPTDCSFTGPGANVIGLSHVIALGTPYAVENQIPASSACLSTLRNRFTRKK
jgi:hypothetical protein